MANEDDQIIRPTFPNQQMMTKDGEDAYNLQLLSAVEACWLEIPEVIQKVTLVYYAIFALYEFKR